MKIITLNLPRELTVAELEEMFIAYGDVKSCNIVTDDETGKSKGFGFDLEDCVMASDAFFPFPDCVEIAYNAGVRSVIQPGGSIKDQLSVDFCDANKMSKVFTGIRHFKH